MHIPYLLYVVCFIIIAYFLKRKFSNKDHIKDDVSSTFWVMVVIVLIWMFLSSLFTMEMEREKSNERSERIEIAAMRAGSSLEGNISLLSGYVGAEPVYNYMRKMPDGSMHLERINANKCFIFEQDIKAGYLVKRDVATRLKDYGNIKKFFFFDYPSSHAETWYEGVRYDFYVPRGSVVQGVSVDLKDFK